MTVLIVDDEKILLEMTKNLIQYCMPDATVIAYATEKEALAYTKQNHVDIAFLDIEIPGMGGVNLAKKICEIHGETNIVFLTAYPEYALQSYEVYATAYVLKPLTREKLGEILDHLRYPVQNKTKIRVSCFGNFEVYHEDVPLHFKRRKAKELFAYLVSKRGATATMLEICAALWEGKTNSVSQNKYFWALVNELSRVFEKIGCEDVLVRGHNSYAVRPKKIECDYYNYINGISGVSEGYHGEFMEQYSWAEYIKGQLDMERNR